MSYAGLQMLMDNLKKLIHGNHDPLINNNPMILSERPQFQLLYQELASIIQTLSNIHKHHHHQLEKVRNLKKTFKDAAEEAQDIIDLFISSLHFRNNRLSLISDVFKTSLDLKNVMKSIKSIKMEFMTLNIDNMKMDSSPTLKTHSPGGTTTSSTRNPLEMKKPLMNDIIVGLDRDAELIRDKLTQDTKQLSVVSIVGMGGLGKTTLATKVFNDPFIVYHFHVRAWVTVSQTYEKRNLLIQILTSSGVQENLEKARDSQLREKLHKNLMGKRYLIVIDDIWSIEAWDDLKLFFPNDNTRSRILLTSRINEVALHAKPHWFIHSLPYLTEEQSWELLKKNVFLGGECPEWLIKPGKQIAKKCQGLPLSVVVMAGVLAKEAMIKDLWENISCSIGSYIVSDEKGCLETLALSYHHLPHHLRECLLYLGGFLEDSRIDVKRMTWLWMAEGFIEESGNRSMEDTGEAYFMDLIDRNLVIVESREFNGDLKSCKLHDLVRELCQQKAKEERFFLNIDRLSLSSQPLELITPYKQRRIFTNQHINDVVIAHPPTPSIRSLICFNPKACLINNVAEFYHSFELLRVLDLQMCQLLDFPQEMALMVHLRYLAIWLEFDFPSSICNLWSLQTLVVKTGGDYINLPSNISNLVNLRHLWCNLNFYLDSIDKPMNLQSISNVVLGDGVDNFQICFPSIKKLACILFSSIEKCHFESLPYIETLKLRVDFDHQWVKHSHNHIWFPETLKKLTLLRCCLPWSYMSTIQSLPNLGVLKLNHNAFLGPEWDAREQQFPRLNFLRLDCLDFKEWEVFSTSFPCLKRLDVRNCIGLKEIPLDIGEIATLELIEIHTYLNYVVVQSLKRIQKEQHDEGNTELKITVNHMELSIYLSEHESAQRKDSESGS